MQTLRGEASGQRPRIMVHHASLRKRELPVHYADYSVARPKEYESKGSAGCAMSMELTLDELADLYMLCEREADQFDYDEGVHVRFTELAEKLSAIIRAKEGGTK
jgi:hypothetical protein